MNSLDVKLPPHSEDSELFVIGSCLIDAGAKEQAMITLRPDDFYTVNMQTVFETIRDMDNANKNIDVSTVAAELKNKNKLDEIGGAETLVSAINSVTTPVLVDFHIGEIKNYSLLRNLIKSCSDISGACFLHEQEPQSILEHAEKAIFSISNTGQTSKLVSAKDIVLEAMENIDNLYQKKVKVNGIETGFSTIDKLTCGLQGGNVAILAARPSMGKTSLALDIVRHNIERGVPCAFFSLEMTKQEMMLRLLSQLSGVGLYNLRTGFFGAEQMERLAYEAEKLYDYPLSLDCSSFNMSAVSIRSACRRLATRLVNEGKKLGLIVIDYLQLIQNTSRRHENRQNEVAEISRAIKAMAIDLDVPVLALSQLNRSPEGRADGRPILSDLRESGSIEQDADLVMFIYREKMYVKGASEEDRAATKLILAKNRNGALGDIDLYFDAKKTSFKEVEKL